MFGFCLKLWQFGTLIDDVTSADAMLNGVDMQLSDDLKDKAYDEARKLAVKKALDSCKEMAEAANMRCVVVYVFICSCCF